MTSDHRTLEAVVQLLEFHPEGVLRPRVWLQDEEQEEEEYGFDEDDFGFDIHTDDFEEDEDEDDWDPDAGTFFSAVKRTLFGNLEFYPTPSDLAKLDGELDL